MADLATFEQYYTLSDLLIERSTKEQLAERRALAGLERCPDCDVRLFAVGIIIFSPQVAISQQQILRLLVLNLFAKRDPITLIKTEQPLGDHQSIQRAYGNAKLWDSSEPDPLETHGGACISA